LTALCGFGRREDFQQAHRGWVEEALVGGPMMQDDRWSEAIAVGSFSFVEKVKSELGVKATHREVVQRDETYTLREPDDTYGAETIGESDTLRTQNTILWDANAEAT